MSDESRIRIDPILDSLEESCRNYLKIESKIGEDEAGRLFSSIEDQTYSMVLAGELSIGEIMPDKKLVTLSELDDGDTWDPLQARAIVRKISNAVEAKRNQRYVQ